MLDPEVKPSPAREIVHKGKGCLAVLVAVAVLAFGGYFVWDRATGFVSTLGEVPDYPGPGKAKVTIVVPAGSSLDVIGGILIDQDVVKSTKAWDQAVRSEERAQSVQAGSYIMKTQMRAIDALRLLINPGASRVRSRFTVPEGLRLSAQVDVLAKETKIKKSSFETALKRPQNLGLPGYARNNPEGFLFPDTYELTAESTATTTMQQMVTQYKTVARDVRLEDSAKKLKRKPLEVLTVASIIEKEVNRPEDRPKVARVIYNRLAGKGDTGGRLEMDSTVNYILRADKIDLSRDDLRNKSPYNTRVNPGLPPGPIGSPGEEALRAAVAPPPGDWVFFVTVNKEGLTKFTGDYQEFLRFKAEATRNGLR
jgi:UPF0755 protein